MKIQAVGIGIVVFVATAGAVAYALRPVAVLEQQPPATNPEAVVCTMEAKQCPDGTYVGRIGPKCEFAPCPIANQNATTGTSTVWVGGQAQVGNTIVGVLGLVEDSRCPSDVQCIQAGTVRVRVSIDAYNRDFILTLGKPESVGSTTVTLIAVIPSEKNSKETIPQSAYRFTFAAQ